MQGNIAASKKSSVCKKFWGKNRNSYCLVWGASEGGGSEQGQGQSLLLLQLQAPPSERETPLLRSRRCAGHHNPAPSPTGTRRLTGTALKTQHCTPAPQEHNYHHEHLTNTHPQSTQDYSGQLKCTKNNLYKTFNCSILSHPQLISSSSVVSMFSTECLCHMKVDTLCFKNI